ncbi:MAG: 6-phosphofructokinase [Clostridia bacterium]|nr:6-phosphofructokinase [Clostridia bacterium]
MKKLYGNAVVGQSGGPTAAINATLSGVIKGALRAKDEGYINTLYGMRNGIEGFLEERLIDLFEAFADKEKLFVLEQTPSAALGSCRKKMKSPKDDPETYEKLIELFKKYDIRYFFYIGGNDSMDTVSKLSQFAREHDYELVVVGVPKTVDNDLTATDHTPGFGSAAKFVATTMKELLCDVSVYTMKAVTIVEVMGRDAGWLTASAALPAVSGGRAPDLIYLPEKRFSPERFIADIKRIQEDHPAVLVAISEGIKFEDGRYVGEGLGGRKVDAFGHVALSGAGKVLEDLVKNELGCKVRSIELNLPQRAAAHIASKTDIDESVGVGSAAVKYATEGKTGIMATIDRAEGEEYSVTFGYRDISTIANAVRGVPDEYINAEANGITEAGLNYLKPLIIGEVDIKYLNGMPEHIVL